MDARVVFSSGSLARPCTRGLLQSILFFLISFLILSPTTAMAGQFFPHENVEKAKSNGYQVQLGEVGKVISMRAGSILSASDNVRLPNPVQIENARPGDPGWQLEWPTTRNGEIEGYASLTSVKLERKISFYISTLDPTYELTIYRIGWYNGVGGRKMMDTITLSGIDQSAKVIEDQETGLVEANWDESYQLRVPRDWTSGVYMAKLVSDGSTTGRRYMSYINFVVRDPDSRANYLFQTSDTTSQAYNNWGGKSLYSGNSTNGERAYKVSFNRPYKGGAGAGRFFKWEVNMLRFLEREGYDVTYVTNIDTHTDREMLLRHKAFLSVGHDEYWSENMRNHIERARNRGVSLGFFGANIGYWQMRFERSLQAGKNLRTMVVYKQSARGKDPLALDDNPDNDHNITIRWRAELPGFNIDPRPEEALIGVMYHGNPVDSDIVVSNAAHWVYAGTGAQNGDLIKGLLGYETDTSFGYAPPGTEVIASSPDPWGYSDMTVYEWEPSGATVFATGSIQWSWGLDGSDIIPSRVSPVAQQMTRNVLARFVRDDTGTSFSDLDNDGITDVYEQQVYGTDPHNADSDNDGISDGEELALWGDRWNEDSDSDSLFNLLDPDSDADSFLDGIEIDQEVDPADERSYPPEMIYEDAENGDTAGWKVYDQGPGAASIKNVYDEDSNSLVIELSGSGKRTGYNLLSEDRSWWGNTRHSIVEWRMKYAEEFIVYIAVQTRDGFRYIYYTNDDNNIHAGLDKYVHHNIGSSANDGNWHTFTRDLVADLKAGQPSNELESVLGFFIRGSGRVDDITLKEQSKMFYEDAENGDTAGWKVYDQGPGTASIKNIYDEDSNSLVIELSGSGKRTGYNLLSEDRSWWRNTRHSIVEWRMKYVEEFIIYIAVQTRDGFRYIYYTNDDNNIHAGLDKYVHHNIGSSANDGNWHTFARDLAADLKAEQSSNELESVLGFFIRGSGLVDDIILCSSWICENSSSTL